VIDWLLAPIDPSRVHDVGVLLSWHGRLMVLAWAVLVPTGILAARYFKIWPGQDWPRQLDDQRWWLLHRGCQYAAVVVMCVALVLVFNAGRDGVAPGPHRVMGWAVVALAAAQVLGGLLRGTKGGPSAPAPDGSLFGDHFNMTPRRLLFEYLHKSAGYVAFCLSIATVLTGLWQSNAPHWMFLVLGLWWVVLIGVFLVLQGLRRRVTTYQAIWGDDADHPGNRARPPRK
jgi:hypothetical protein